MENHDLQYWVIVFSQLIGKFGNFFVAILVSLVLYGIYLAGTDGNMGISPSYQVVSFSRMVWGVVVSSTISSVIADACCLPLPPQAQKVAQVRIK